LIKSLFLKVFFQYFYLHLPIESKGDAILGIDLVNSLFVKPQHIVTIPKQSTPTQYLLTPLSLVSGTFPALLPAAIPELNSSIVEHPPQLYGIPLFT